MSNRQLALLANCVVVVGVFCPIVTVPFLGAQNFFQNGTGDGIIVLGLAAIGFVLISSRRFWALFITGGLSLLVSVFTLLNLLSKLNSLRNNMESELKGNPFAGLAEAAMHSVQVQWGWIPLIGGATILMIAAWNCYKERELAASAEVTAATAANMASVPDTAPILAEGSAKPGQSFPRRAALAVVAASVVGVFAVIIWSAAHSNLPSGSLGASSTPGTTVQPTTDQAPAQPVQAPQVLLSLSGSGTKSTQSFTVPDEWSLAWSYDCSDFSQQGNFIVSVYNSDGSPSSADGVNQLGSQGSDTEYFHKGGRIYLEVNSECRWVIKVIG